MLVVLGQGVWVKIKVFSKNQLSRLHFSPNLSKIIPDEEMASRQSILPTSINSAGTDGVPLSRVCAGLTFHLAPHWGGDKTNLKKIPITVFAISDNSKREKERKREKKHL